GGRFRVTDPRYPVVLRPAEPGGTGVTGEPVPRRGPVAGRGDDPVSRPGVERRPGGRNEGRERRAGERRRGRQGECFEDVARTAAGVGGQVAGEGVRPFEPDQGQLDRTESEGPRGRE